MEPEIGTNLPSIVAAELYMTARNDFSFEAVANRTNIDVYSLRTRYGSKTDLLRQYYSDSWHRYIVMEVSVPDFSQFSLAEKLTTLIFSLCDEFDTVHGFAKETYAALMRKSVSQTGLMHPIRDRIRLYINGDANISVFVKYLPSETTATMLAWIVLYLINERVHDRSADKDRTSALTDKVTTLVQSILYTGTLDHLVDVARYLGITYYPRK